MIRLPSFDTIKVPKTPSVPRCLAEQFDYVRVLRYNAQWGETFVDGWLHYAHYIGMQGNALALYQHGLISRETAMQTLGFEAA